MYTDGSLRLWVGLKDRTFHWIAELGGDSNLDAWMAARMKRINLSLRLPSRAVFSGQGFVIKVKDSGLWFEREDRNFKNNSPSWRAKGHEIWALMNPAINSPKLSSACVDSSRLYSSKSLVAAARHDYPNETPPWMFFCHHNNEADIDSTTHL